MDPDAASVRTRLSSSDIKGTMKVFKKKYCHLSPAIGCAMSHSPFLLNVYCFGTAQSAAVKLVRELFWKTGHSEHLHPTHNKSKPAFFLNPERLGLLIGLVEKNKLQDQAALQALLEPWYRESRCSRKSLACFIGMVKEAIQECSPDYPSLSLFYPHTVTHVLLAFLWQSVTSREQLLAYLLSVDRTLEVKGSIFRSKLAASEKKRDKWLKKSFNRFDVCEDGFVGDKVKKGRIYEFMTAKALLLRNRLVPSTLTYHWYGYKGQISRPDCVESCIRNVINILLFDIEAQKFDVSRLEVLRPYQPLLQFYKGEGRFVGLGPQSGDHFAILSMASGQAWMELLSNLPGVQYLSGAPGQKYEIQPDICNVLAVLNLLFNVQAATFTDLGRLISRKDCSISFKVGQVTTVRSITRGEIVVSFDIKGIKLDAVRLVIEEGHAWMKYPVSGCWVADEEELVAAWMKWIKQDKHSHVLQLLALLMEPWKCLFLSFFGLSFVEARQIYQLLMSLSVSDSMVEYFDEEPNQHWLVKDFAKNYRRSKQQSSLGS